MGILDGNRFRRGGCFKRSCGYSTQVRNGTMLPQSYPNYKTVHRRFQTWCSNDVLRRVLTDVANELRDKGVLDEEESFIDATFAMAKGGGAEIGPTKRGKGMKNHGDCGSPRLPPYVSTHAANHHEVGLVPIVLRLLHD